MSDDRTPDYLNEERPVLKDGEYLCDGCWKVSESRVGWVTYKFKYLKETNLCTACIIKWGEDLEKKKDFGL